MSEFTSSFESEEEAALPFSFNSPDSLQNELARDILMSGEAGWWAAERSEKYAEILRPVFMYVRDLGGIDEHRVVWMQHEGMLIRHSEFAAGTFYHVVCDCADGPSRDLLPQESFHCEVTHMVRQQHADTVGKRLGIAEVVEYLSEFDTTAMEFRLSDEGVELMMSALEGVIQSDHLHPEDWMANEISGRHDPDTLARMIKRPPETVIPLLQKLHREGRVEYDGDSVKLAA